MGLLKESGCASIALVYLCLYGGSALIGLFIAKDTWNSIDFLQFAIIAIVIASLIVGFINMRLNNKINKLESKIRSLEYRHDRNVESIKKDFQKQKDALEQKVNVYQNIAEGSVPFKYSASLVADMNVVIYAEAADYLRNKERPAWKTADKVRQLSNRTKEAIAKERSTTYKLEMLLKLFPEIRRYFDEDDALMSLAECDSYQTFVEKRDRSRDYLTEEEWNQMSVDDRNQLALDRWKERPKSNWTIGMLYEMYVGSLLRPKNFNVIQFGILKGLYFKFLTIAPDIPNRMIISLLHYTIAPILITEFH